MSELKRFTGYQPIQETIRERLPVGGYIARIQQVKVDNLPNGTQRLVFRTEIIEGPYKDFFHKDFAAQSGGMYAARYHGDYSVLCPDERGTDSRIVDWFNRTLGAIEGSNPGFRWDWRTDSLVGLVVGLSIREAEYQGSCFTEIGKFIPVSMIREGTFRPMRKKLEREHDQHDIPPVYNSQPAPAANMASRAETPAPAAPTPQSLLSQMNELDIPF